MEKYIERSGLKLIIIKTIKEIGLGNFKKTSMFGSNKG